MYKNFEIFLLLGSNPSIHLHRKEPTILMHLAFSKKESVTGQNRTQYLLTRKFRPRQFLPGHV